MKTHLNFYLALDKNAINYSHYYYCYWEEGKEGERRGVREGTAQTPRPPQDSEAAYTNSESDVEVKCSGGDSLAIPTSRSSIER